MRGEVRGVPAATSRFGNQAVGRLAGLPVRRAFRDMPPLQLPVCRHEPTNLPIDQSIQPTYQPIHPTNQSTDPSINPSFN